MSTAAKTGVLLMNLGTPDAPTPEAIRRYLRQFLHDYRVIDLSRWIWCPILHGIILPLRPRKLAPQYAAIWRPDGSPLLAITRLQAAALTAELKMPVAVAMRYGSPDATAGLAELQAAGVTRVIALPTYPQYSHTTTASSFDSLDAAFAHMNWQPDVRKVSDYHADARYITALADSVRAHWSAQGRAQKLLMSFHGLPQRYVDAGDPYETQCLETARNLAAALALQQGEWQVAWQSRVGKAQWLQPYTDVLLDELPRAGVKTLDVICPGFAADCLETLDEIATRYAAQFVAAGGEHLRYIPALNATDSHVRALAGIVTQHAV